LSILAAAVAELFERIENVERVIIDEAVGTTRRV